MQILGEETLLEDQLAAIATYEWQLAMSNGMSRETSRRYADQIERMIAGLGSWRAPDGSEGPVTVWHLATPGVGPELVHAWRISLEDPDEVCGPVFGDGFRAIQRFFEEYLCRKGQIVDYDSLSRLGRGATRQTGTLLLADRYGPIINPFPTCWRPPKKQRKSEPVPRFGEWLHVLDVLWAQQQKWSTLPQRKAFPLIRAVNMLYLQSATGLRPGELRLVKQGHLLSDRLLILYGAEKDRLPRTRGYDLYNHRLGRYRETPFCYVPDELRRRILTWPTALKSTGRLASEPERALFPNGFGWEEDCVSYERYRTDLKRILLAIAREPSVQPVLGPYLVRRSPKTDTWDLRLTPHTTRAIYATHRMNSCDTPGAFRALMQDLGWNTPSTVLRYDRPSRVDAVALQDQFLGALRKELP
jgi:integrase